jgi:hypothetical protein
MFLGSIKAPVPSSRPGISSAVAPQPGQIRRLRRDRSHAQPPLGGKHGEDPQFDRAERGAILWPGEAARDQLEHRFAWISGKPPLGVAPDQSRPYPSGG